MLDDARHPPDVLEEGSRRNAWITAVERRHESLEQAREPAVIRRLLELRRVIEPLHRARALETQLAARPLDRARVPDEPDAVLARPCGPREEHGDQPAGIFEPHRRRVLHLVAGVA